MLDINLDGVRDPKGLEVPGGELHYVTFTLATFMGLHVGIREITEGTAPELLYRIRQHEELYGAYMGGPRGPRYFTAADIERHRGMKVNASPMTNSKFDADMTRRRKEETPRRRREVAREFERLGRAVS